MKRLIDRVDGVETWYHSEPGGEFTIQTVEDAEPALDYVNWIKDHGKQTWQGDGWRYLGRVPRGVMNKFLADKGLSWSAFNTDKDIGPKFFAWLQSEASKLVVAPR